MRVNVLDHGYLELVESWGSDQAIIEAARMSTGKGFLGWGPDCSDCEGRGWFLEDSFTETEHKVNCERCKGTGKAGDEKLLAYLWNNRHATPFEMAGMTIEVQAPILVFREWRTHRTAAQVADEYEWDDCFPGDCSYNEMSARYVPLPALDYIPTVERLMTNSKTNKQAGVVKDAVELTTEQAELFQMRLEAMYKSQESLYQGALQAGVPKELARVHLPVGRYSKMRASANLRNWLAFLTLRMDEKAQWEIRQYANEVGKLIAEKFPRTWALFAGGQQTYTKKNG